MFDNHVNLLSGSIQTPPSPATTGTTWTLMPGDSARFQTNMPVTVAPPNVQPTFDNAEICYLTGVSGDELTVERAQEGTIAKPIAAGWQVYGTMTAKTVTDIEAAITEVTDKHFSQSFTNSDTVTVTHNLGKYPAVTVTNSAHDIVEGSVTYTDLNNLVLTFSSSFTGRVLCN